MMGRDRRRALLLPSLQATGPVSPWELVLASALAIAVVAWCSMLFGCGSLTPCGWVPSQGCAPDDARMRATLPDAGAD